jgi:hypothetical protein
MNIIFGISIGDGAEGSNCSFYTLRIEHMYPGPSSSEIPPQKGKGSKSWHGIMHNDFNDFSSNITFLNFTKFKAEAGSNGWAFIGVGVTCFILGFLLGIFVMRICHKKCEAKKATNSNLKEHELLCLPDQGTEPAQ